MWFDKKKEVKVEMSILLICVKNNCIVITHYYHNSNQRIEEREIML
jgi:hypothetical protein